MVGKSLISIFKVTHYMLYIERGLYSILSIYLALFFFYPSLKFIYPKFSLSIYTSFQLPFIYLRFVSVSDNLHSKAIGSDHNLYQRTCLSVSESVCVFGCSLTPPKWLDRLG